MQSIFNIKTTKKQDIIDITNNVKEIVKKSKIKDGICLVYVRHATSAIIINENYDPSVCEDILTALNKIIPEHAGYKHDKIDNNAAAHIRAAILGPSENIPIKDGTLQLGRWQGIGLVEIDGPRDRTVLVKIIKS